MPPHQHTHSRPARQRSSNNMSHDKSNSSQQLHVGVAPQQHEVPVQPPVGLALSLAVDWNCLLPIKAIIFGGTAAKSNGWLLVTRSTCSRRDFPACRVGELANGRAVQGQRAESKA